MKKIIDSNGKLFSKINIVDLAIVLVIIVLILSKLVLSSSTNNDETRKSMLSDKTIEYTVEISQIRQMSIDALNENLEKIVDPETKKALGKIVDIETSKAYELLRLIDGTYKKTEYKDKYNLLLTIQVPGTETDDNYYTAEGSKLIVGDTISMYNDHVVSYGAIKSVRVLEDDK